MAMQNVYAHEVRKGDYLQTLRDARGGSGRITSSRYVQRAVTEGDVTTVRVSAGVSDIDLAYDAFAGVWIDRD